MSWNKYRKPLEPGRKVAEIENMPVTIRSVRFAVSEYGELAIMAVTILETGEQCEVLTSGQVVMEMLQKAKDDLPLDAIFYKEKKYWNIKDVRDSESAAVDAADAAAQPAKPGDDELPF